MQLRHLKQKTSSTNQQWSRLTQENETSILWIFIHVLLSLLFIFPPKKHLLLRKEPIFLYVSSLVLLVFSRMHIRLKRNTKFTVNWCVCFHLQLVHLRSIWTRLPVNTLLTSVCYLPTQVLNSTDLDKKHALHVVFGVTLYIYMYVCVNVPTCMHTYKRKYSYEQKYVYMTLSCPSP